MGLHERPTIDGALLLELIIPRKVELDQIFCGSLFVQDQVLLAVFMGGASGLLNFAYKSLLAILDAVFLVLVET